MTKGDFRKKAKQEKLPFPLPTSEEPTQKPQAREHNFPKPGEDFKPATEDFRKKE
jgi:hypothetical protein